MKKRDGHKKPIFPLEFFFPPDLEFFKNKLKKARTPQQRKKIKVQINLLIGTGQASIK